MLYVLVRILLFTIVFVLAYLFLLRKAKIVRKKLIVVLLLFLCMLLCSASTLLPIENLFVRFSSPQDVFRYSGNGSIEDVVYGKESCLLLGSESIYFIPKSDNGYKIGTAFSEKTVANIFNKNGGYQISNVSGTNDFYVWGSTVIKGDDFTISDSVNSDIKIKQTQNGDTNYYTVSVYGLINGYTDDYYLVVNHEKQFFLQTLPNPDGTPSHG